MIRLPIAVIVLVGVLLGCSENEVALIETTPIGKGPYPVGSTNLEIAAAFADVGDERMHDYLLGQAEGTDRRAYLADILKYPDAAWVTEVPVPEDVRTYGPAAGMTLSVVSFIAYPAAPAGRSANPYAFPYHNALYGSFDDMLKPGEAPRFADADARYPLIVLAHGAQAHGIYDVRHAHDLASRGYIVAVINYGDERTAVPEQPNWHVGFLRSLLTRAVIDSVVDSATFGPHVEADNIGLTGHSYGGFTALAVSGAAFLGNPATVHDERIKANVIAAPWLGGEFEGEDLFPFGENNVGLNAVDTPTICLFGSRDEVTQASYILPAIRQLAGPAYVIELVDQPHVFEQGSWQDRDAWEALFFDAYLKGNPASLQALESAQSMQGGGEDRQLFDYQVLPD